MSVAIWLAVGVLVADLVLLVVILGAMAGRSDARLEAMAVRRWLEARRTGQESSQASEPADRRALSSQ